MKFMENSINISKTLQKLFWGLIFSLIIILFIIKVKDFDLKQLISDLKNFSGFVQSITLVIFLILISIVGLKIQDLVIMSIQDALYFFYRFNFIKRIIKKIGFDNIFISDGQLAKNIFIKFSEDILKFYYLKSWAQPEVMGSIEGLDSHLNNVKEHILNIKNNELLVHIDYYNSVTQEQAKRDQIRNNIKEQYYILINTCFVLIYSLTVFSSIIYYVVFCLLYIIFLVFILKVVIKIKNQLGFYIINGYIDCFTLGQGATIVDRESNTE